METTVPSILAGLGIALAVGLPAYGSATATVWAVPYFVGRAGKDQTIIAVAPLVISGVLAIYGMIVAIIASQVMNDPSNKESLTILEGGRIFAAGLAVGLPCWVSGQGLADIFMSYSYNGSRSGDSGRTTSGGGGGGGVQLVADQQEQATPLVDTGNNNKYYATKRRPLLIGQDIPDVTLRLVVSLFMMEAIGLYGLIVALVVISV